MVGGMVTAYMGGLHFWWPKITGRMYPEDPGESCGHYYVHRLQPDVLPAVYPRYLGMPRRYHAYPEEFQVLNVLSSAGASVLAVGFILPLIYFLWSLQYGEVAGDNPWGATGLEWQTTSPPPTHNFHEVPVVTARTLCLWRGGGNKWPLTRQPSTRQPPGHHPALAHHFDSMEQQQGASTFGMWVFLLTKS